MVSPPDDETVVLDFDTVIGKYLYMNTRAHGQPFELYLAPMQAYRRQHGQLWPPENTLWSTERIFSVITGISVSSRQSIS